MELGSVGKEPELDVRDILRICNGSPWGLESVTLIIVERKMLSSIRNEEENLCDKGLWIFLTSF